MKKRFLSFLLVFLMIVCLAPAPTLAEDLNDASAPEEPLVEADSEAISSAARAASSETCGEHLTWTLGDDGTLTISGSGDMYNYSKETSPWYSIKSNIKSVVIESGVTGIGDYAFYECMQIQSVSIPQGVTRIGYRAFYYCSLIPEITLPVGVERIEEQAFFICSSLAKLSISDGVKFIGSLAFGNCHHLTEITIPGSVESFGNGPFMYDSGIEKITLLEGAESIGYDLFQMCKNLKTVELPSTLRNIPNNPFKKCPSLVNISFPSGNPNFTAEDGVLFNKDKTEIIACAGSKESYTVPATVTNIRGTAFSDCASLKNITIPDSVNGIGMEAFSGCSSLKEVKLPAGLSEISAYLFRECSELETVTVPDSVTSIENSAFLRCPKLKTIEIPAGVTNLGYHVFDGCSVLNDIKIPDGVTALNDYVFYNCAGLTSITIPAGVTKIGKYVFSGCTNLREITFAGKAPEFDAAAFDNFTATAYYPADDATWTEDVRQNYGGSISWIAYTSDGPVDPPIIDPVDPPVNPVTAKAANTLSVTGKTAKVKFKKLKKKTQYLDVSSIITFANEGQGTKTYALGTVKKGKKSFKKYFKVDASTGRVTVKKKLKKGTYTMQLAVQASGDASYEASAPQAVMVKIKVK